MHTLIDDVAPPAPLPADAPEPPLPSRTLPARGDGEPPEGGEPPLPPVSFWRRFYQHPAFRGALWFAAVLLGLIAIGLLFPPSFWRF